MTSEVPAEWHRIRIPAQAELDRKRGLPHDHINLSAMQAWCETSCAGPWHAGETDRGGTVYRFRERDDVMAFALRWFPFKCN
jgi:hypothetical protein